MPSTYTTNNGIERPADGEQNDTWGSTLRDNWDIIDQSLDGQAVETLAATGTTGAPNTITITDGATSTGKNRFIDVTDGGDLGGTAYLQLSPNDAEKVITIRNSLSASRSLIVFQGTYNASNDFEIENGYTHTLLFNGGGASATVTEIYEQKANLVSANIGSLTSSAITIEAAAPVLNFSDTAGDPDGTIQYGGTAHLGFGASRVYTYVGIDFGVGKLPTVPLQVAYTDASASTTAIIENESTNSNAQVRFNLQRGGDSGTGLVRGGTFFVTGNSFGVADYEARDINFLTGTSAGSASARVRIPAEGGLRIETTTVSGLPSASTVGAGTRHFVTDANATTFASVVAGGGSNGVPVYSDGTNWRIG